MDSFDRRILATLKDGASRDFGQILSEAGLSHNTLRLHLDGLEEQGLVVRRKRRHDGPGRPSFTYSLSMGVGQASSALADPYRGLVALSFERLQHLCRHEKGGYCKEVRGSCEPRNCPQIIK